MAGETNLDILLKTMKPRLNPGDYVFCTCPDESVVNKNDALLFFKEEEGITMILSKELADIAGLDYSYIASWITLTVHSSLDAVGLTAAFSTKLSDNEISCNVVAGYYHDHLFIKKEHEVRAMQILNEFSV